MDTISTEKFYGKVYKKKPKSDINWIKIRRVMPSHILGPTQYWKEFSKQADALAAAAECSTKTDTLCTFVYQRVSDGIRKFVVAHPEVYWWYYKAKPQEQRCSYEVIPEGSPCWLYLDLEYLMKLNPLCDGLRMTKTVIEVIRAYLHSTYGLFYDRNNILILDSTSNEKFSRHVIFTMKDLAFKDNLHVGRFIKDMCNDIMLYLNSDTQSDGLLKLFKKTDIKEMLVETTNGKKLFIDNGVYTKNRHFRVYLSTKWGKQSYLTVSPDCTHIPLNKCKEKELGIFLDSLISYFPNKQNLIQIEYFSHSTGTVQFYSKVSTRTICKDDNQKSPYPQIDKYISNIVEPGKIRVTKYNDETKILKYEIYGNRFCENIGRWHKSNNIYWIVDLNKQEIYQKCHDEDCSGFSSIPRRLPEEIYFMFDREGDSVISNVTIDENITQK